MLRRLKRLRVLIFGTRDERNEVSDGSVPLENNGLEAELNRTPL